MKQRSFLTILMALALVIGLLSGCGSSQSAAAKEADALIAEIGDVITLDSEKTIAAAEKAVSRLTTEERRELTGYITLKAAREKLNTLQAEEVDDLIQALGIITADKQAAVKAAREAYDALNAEAKAEVENLYDLERAEQALADILNGTAVQEESEESSQAQEAQESSAAQETAQESSTTQESSAAESSEASETSADRVTAADNAILNIRYEDSTFYNLAEVETAISLYNQLTTEEKLQLTYASELESVLRALDLMNGTADNTGYLAKIGMDWVKATQAEAVAAFQFHNFRVEETEEGIELYVEVTNISNKTVAQYTYYTVFLDENNNAVMSAYENSYSDSFWLWDLYDDTQYAPGESDPGEEYWGPYVAATGFNPIKQAVILAVRIDYVDGSYLMIVGDELVATYNQ